MSNKCDCCGWDDEGYIHEPHCSSLKEQPKEKWEDRFDNKFDETFYRSDTEGAMLDIANDIKNFIRETIKTEREQAVKEERERILKEIDKLLTVADFEIREGILLVSQEEVKKIIN